MRALIQRTLRASVTIDGELRSSIGKGILILLGIEEADSQEDIDYLTSIYIPRDMQNKKDFNDLIEIIDTLRGENGCPWDMEQTHESIKNQLLEEAYELGKLF